MTNGNLAGRKVLVIEDEFYLAEDLAGALRDQGAEVLGPMATVEAARRAVADDGFDCAVLDMNLRGEASAPIADALRDAGVPMLMVTGYSRDALPERLQDVPYVEKPTEAARVATAVTELLGVMGGH